VGQNTVALFRHDDLDAVVNKPVHAIMGIQSCIMTGQKNSVSITDEGVVHSDAITVMPSIHSREVTMYIAMENGIHAVTAGSIQRNPLLLKNLLDFLREDLGIKLQKNPFG
jgi:hypothetical protein